ncbi:hypothetical protein [Flavicella sp.]|uniref:hypothetical protein n=1 Tax=Flavicella sp. TaxID=2957742 RepID=UPI0026177F9D|nr:hypothetical protein [Flavicella sp.]MDG1804340.1 hypothetical protein [Flavicella sp.]
MTTKKEDRNIIQLLSQGADERIFTNEIGLTKYGIELTNLKVINRGSCTCSVTTKDSFNLMKAIARSNKTEKDWITKYSTLEQKKLGMSKQDEIKRLKEKI